MLLVLSGNLMCGGILTWSAGVAACFHLVTNADEEGAGADVSRVVGDVGEAMPGVVGVSLVSMAEVQTRTLAVLECMDLGMLSALLVEPCLVQLVKLGGYGENNIVVERRSRRWWKTKASGIEAHYALRF
jgi:hypothetical protein